MGIKDKKKGLKKPKQMDKRRRKEIRVKITIETVKVKKMGDRKKVELLKKKVFLFFYFQLHPKPPTHGH